MKLFGMPSRRELGWHWRRQDTSGDGEDDGNGIGEGGNPGGRPGPPQPPGAPGLPGPPGQRPPDSTSTTSTTSTTSIASTSTSQSSTSTSRLTTSTTSTTPAPTTSSTTSSPPPPPPTSSSSSSSSTVRLSTNSSPQPAATTATSAFSSVSVKISTTPLVSFSQVPQVSRTTSTPVPIPVIATSFAPLSTFSTSTTPLFTTSSSIISLASLVLSSTVSTRTSSQALPTSFAATAAAASSAEYGINSEHVRGSTGTFIGIGLAIGASTAVISAILMFLFKRTRKPKDSDTTLPPESSRSIWYRPSPPPKGDIGTNKTTPDLENGKPFADPAAHNRHTTDFNPPPPTKPTFSPTANRFFPAPALNIPPTESASSTSHTSYRSPLSLFPFAERPPFRPPFRQSVGTEASTASTVSTGFLTRSWFAGKRDTLKMTVKNGKVVQAHVWAVTEEKERMREMEREMEEQERRWGESRRELDARSSVITEAKGEGEKRSTWASGLGDDRSARFASGLSSPSVRAKTVESFETKTTKSVDAKTSSSEEVEYGEAKEGKMLDSGWGSWDSEVERLSGLPRWRDPVTSIFEEVRKKSGKE